MTASSGKGKGGKDTAEDRKGSNKSSKVDGSIRLPEEEGGTKTRSIVSASFCGKDEVIVVHSNGVVPIFERVVRVLCSIS